MKQKRLRLIDTRVAELLAQKCRIEQRQITHEEVAAQTGLSLGSFRSWLYNKSTRFDSHSIYALCQYFACDVGELLVLGQQPKGDQPS